MRHPKGGRKAQKAKKIPGNSSSGEAPPQIGGRQREAIGRGAHRAFPRGHRSCRRGFACMPRLVCNARRYCIHRICPRCIVQRGIGGLHRSRRGHRRGAVGHRVVNKLRGRVGLDIVVPGIVGVGIAVGAGIELLVAGVPICMRFPVRW